MSMRTLILSGALGFAAVSCAQDSTAVRSRWRIGVSGSFDLAYRTLTTESSDPSYSAIVDLLNEVQDPKNSYTLGFDLRRDLGRYWILATGLQFTDRGYRMETSDFISVDPIETDPVIPESIKETYHYQYFSLPLMAHYRFGNGKVHFEPGVGLWTDLLHDAYSTVHQEFSNGRVEDSRNSFANYMFRSVTVTACAEFDVHLTLARRWDLRIAPRGRYQLIPSSDTTITNRLWEAGLVFGCFYRL